MPLSFKISFEKIDFKDEEFIIDIAKVEEFYNAGIVLEYKQNKEKLTKKFSSYSEIMQFIEMDENDSIKYCNLSFSTPKSMSILFNLSLISSDLKSS